MTWEKEDVKCKESIFRRCYANESFWLLLSSAGLFSGVHNCLGPESSKLPQNSPRHWLRTAQQPVSGEPPLPCSPANHPCPAHQPVSPGLRKPCSCHLAARTGILHFITSGLRLEIPWQGLQQHRLVCLPAPSLLRAPYGTKRRRARSWSETGHWLTSCAPSRTLWAVAYVSKRVTPWNQGWRHKMGEMTPWAWNFGKWVSSSWEHEWRGSQSHRIFHISNSWQPPSFISLGLGGLIWLHFLRWKIRRTTIWMVHHCLWDKKEKVEARESWLASIHTCLTWAFRVGKGAVRYGASQVPSESRGTGSREL